jgi:hypothetical protein
MLFVRHAGPVCAGKSAKTESAQGLQTLHHEPDIVGGDQQGLGDAKKPRQSPEFAVRFLVQNLDAIATLIAGLWATHV